MLLMSQKLGGCGCLNQENIEFARDDWKPAEKIVLGKHGRGPALLTMRKLKKKKKLR